MVAVSIQTGPVSANDSPRDVPKEKWFNLLLARRSEVHVCIPYDCRSLLRYVQEAEEFRMWEQTDHADLNAYIRDGLKIDPELLEWAKLGLAAFEEGTPVPLQTAVDAGKKAAQTLANAVPLAAHGGDRKREAVDQGVMNTLKRGSTNAPYLAARIKRDAPEIAERVLAGEFRSIRQAAIAAGIVKETPPLVILKRAWKKASSEEQRQFLEWMANENLLP